MNPFKDKSLEKFTITDCEIYLQNYPYGEHANEVRKYLRKLKQGNAFNSNMKKNEGGVNGVIVQTVLEKKVCEENKPNSKTEKSERKTQHDTRKKNNNIINEEDNKDDRTFFSGIPDVIKKMVFFIIICLVSYFVCSRWGILPTSTCAVIGGGIYKKLFD